MALDASIPLSTMAVMRNFAQVLRLGEAMTVQFEGMQHKDSNPLRLWVGGGGRELGSYRAPPVTAASCAWACSFV